MSWLSTGLFYYSFFKGLVLNLLGPKISEYLQKSCLNSKISDWYQGKRRRKI